MKSDRWFCLTFFGFYFMLTQVLLSFNTPKKIFKVNSKKYNSSNVWNYCIIIDYLDNIRATPNDQTSEKDLTRNYSKVLSTVQIWPCEKVVINLLCNIEGNCQNIASRFTSYIKMNVSPGILLTEISKYFSSNFTSYLSRLRFINKLFQ